MQTLADRDQSLPPFVPDRARVRSNFPAGAVGFWCELFSASGECYATGWHGATIPDLPILAACLKAKPDYFVLPPSV